MLTTRYSFCIQLGKPCHPWEHGKQSWRETLWVTQLERGALPLSPDNQVPAHGHTGMTVFLPFLSWRKVDSSKYEVT